MIWFLKKQKKYVSFTLPKGNMQYSFFNINDLSEDMVKKYYPMLTEHKKNKLKAESDSHNRAVDFCAEMCARQCLSREFGSPEFSFSLFINPNSACAVSNYKASLCVVNEGDFIACATDRGMCGIGICMADEFEFSEAQAICTDRELRDIFSYSVYSFAELINRKTCSETAVTERFALYKSLKDAYFRASGRAVRNNFRNAEFVTGKDSIICSDRLFSVSVHEYHKKSGYVLCVLTGRTK